MLFNYKYLDKIDASEDCIVAKIFLGVLFNGNLAANEDWKLAKAFLRFYIETADGLDFSGAEILIKPKFSWFSNDSYHFKDHTAPDVILHFPNQVLIAIEAKYTLPIQRAVPPDMPHQLMRESVYLADLGKMLGTKETYLFLLMSHKRLFAHLGGPKGNIGRKVLLQCSEQFGDAFRMNTWNCIYHVIKNADERQLPSKNEILDFLAKNRIT